MFVRGTTVFRALVLSPGETPTFRAFTFRALQISPGESTHIPRTSNTPPSATRLREPPYMPVWLRETPYATIGVFPVVFGVFTTKFTARAGIPLQFNMRPRLHYPDSDNYGGWAQITLYATDFHSTTFLCCGSISFLSE